jgi:branched-chain amino acid transport system ATP-binding protein
MEVTERIRDEGVTILLADQNLRFCKRVADKGYILEKGLIQYQGTMSEIWQNQEVVSKYLVVGS